MMQHLFLLLSPLILLLLMGIEGIELNIKSPRTNFIINLVVVIMLLISL